MSYRCDICGIKVPPRQSPLIHRTFYPDSGQIKRELKCCDGCHLMLDEVPLKSVKDPYYLKVKAGSRVEVKVDLVREARPSALVPVAMDLSLLEETFSRR